MGKRDTLHPVNLIGFSKETAPAFVSGDFAIMRNIHSVLDTPLIEMVRTPQYVELGRVVVITGGCATYSINLIDYETKKGDILVIPQHNYISITAMSDDFDGEIVSFSHNPISIGSCMHLRPESSDFIRIRHFIQLLWEVANQSYNSDSISHLQSALLCDLQQMQTQQVKACQEQPSRSQELFYRFLEAHRREQLPRTVKAYADYLCISPNHLSAVVKKVSGKSVMDWINAHCILRAQVLLRNSDLPIYEIAERLEFKSATLFSRFFFRETGQTPKQYRKGNTI